MESNNDVDGEWVVWGVASICIFVGMGFGGPPSVGGGVRLVSRSSESENIGARSTC